MSTLPLWLLALCQWTGAVVLSAAIGFVILKLVWVTAQALHYIWFLRRGQDPGKAGCSGEAGLKAFALKWLELMVLGVAPEPTVAGRWAGWQLRRTTDQ